MKVEFDIDDCKSIAVEAHEIEREIKETYCDQFNTLTTTYFDRTVPDVRYDVTIKIDSSKLKGFEDWYRRQLKFASDAARGMK